MSKLFFWLLLLLAAPAFADVTDPTTPGGGSGGITALTGDCAASGTGSVALTCTASNGVALATTANSVRLLYQFGVPVIMPSSGTIGSNGALTLTTALLTTFPNCWMYFPAGAINSGSAAGVYFVQMSSTTLGTVFNNVLASGAPSVISSPTAFSGTTGTSYTQSTSAQAILTLPITGGIIGANGALRYTAATGQNTTAGNKAITFVWGGQTVQSQSSTTTAFTGLMRTLRNSGSQARQIIFSNSSATANDLSGASSPASIATVDTSTTQNLVVNVTLAVATDDFMFFGGTVEILSAP